MPSFKITEHHNMLNSINLKPHPQARPMHAENIEMDLGTKLVLFTEGCVWYVLSH